MKYLVTLLIALPAALLAAPALAEVEAVEELQIGPAREAWLREGLTKPEIRSEQIESPTQENEDKRIRFHHAILGYEWDYSPYFQAYTYASFTGGPEDGALIIEDLSHRERVRISLRTQATEIVASDGAWGIVPDIPDGVKELYAGAKVNRIGNYRLTVEVGGRTVNHLTMQVRRILDPYACYLGAGTDFVFVEFYMYSFDQAPRTRGVHMWVGDREVPAEMHLFENGVQRIDALIRWDEYREIFNAATNRFDWSERQVRVRTDSPAGDLVRTLMFVPPLEMPHC